VSPTPVRTVLVVVAAPHAWALLRDRLDSELAQVTWATPEQAAVAGERLRPWPWAVAGEGPASLLAAQPAGRPVLFFDASRPGGWQAATAELSEALHHRLAGLELAPARGLRLAGSVLPGSAPELEALLGAGELGVAMSPPHRRRARMQLRRLPGLPLRLRSCGERLVLEVADVDAA
jgi:hypothetical protein